MMGIDPDHLRLYVIRPVLRQLDLHSLMAENLLLGTSAQETRLGTYLRQIGGPAMGVYQMEPNTHDWHWAYLRTRGWLGDRVRYYLVGCEPQAKQLVWNLAYATAMSRVHYWRIRERLPDASDVEGMARYWKKYYNTSAGDGTEEEFVRNYHKYVLRNP